MKNLTALFIRACKSRDPLKRCHSVYNRFYIRSGNKSVINNELSYILAKICDEQLGVLSHTDALAMMTTPLTIYHCVLDDIEEARARVYIDKIRYTETNRFKEVLPLPLRFKSEV
jgi:hypothetical protein